MFHLQDPAAFIETHPDLIKLSIGPTPSNCVTVQRKKLIVCDYCDKVFRYPAFLRKHLDSCDKKLEEEGWGMIEPKEEHDPVDHDTRS